MRQSITFALALLALAAAGCPDGAQPGAGSDTDTDADTDTDTDAGDYWDWESVVIPGNFVGHQWYHRVFAVAADDAAICAQNYVNGTGGILAFDGAALVTEETGFVCEFIWGLGADHVWALGYIDETFDPVIYSRSGGAWSVDTVADADDSCAFEAIYGAAADAVTVVGWCGGERRSWIADGAGAWIAGAATVPTNDELDDIRGVLAMPEADVFYGSGLFESGGATDLGYAAERALWVGGAALESLSVLEGDALLSYAGASWSEALACPYDLSTDPYAVCWSCAARDGASDDVYLGGGRGGAANENVDDWRLDVFADGVVTRILEPCGGDAPRCGVNDLSLSSDGVLFAIASRPQPVLMWHPIPAGE